MIAGTIENIVDEHECIDTLCSRCIILSLEDEVRYRVVLGSVTGVDPICCTPHISKLQKSTANNLSGRLKIP